MKHPSRIVLLVGLLSLLVLPLVSSVGQDDRADKLAYVGAAKCKMCHNMPKLGKFFDDWKESPHAKAFDLLKDAEKKDAKCLKCHTTGYGMPGGFVSVDDKESEKLASVQCEMCHGPGEKHIKSKRGGEVIPHAWNPEEKTCVKCHNAESPTWKEDRYVDENGNKSGFNYNMAVKKINHAKVYQELGKKPPKTGDL